MKGAYYETQGRFTTVMSVSSMPVGWLQVKVDRGTASPQYNVNITPSSEALKAYHVTLALAVKVEVSCWAKRAASCPTVGTFPAKHISCPDAVRPVKS